MESDAVPDSPRLPASGLGLVLAILVAYGLIILALLYLGPVLGPILMPLTYNFLPAKVFMLSPTEGWIVGQQINIHQPGGATAVSLHLHNGKWSRVPIPTDRLDDIWVVSPDDAWATDVLSGIYHFDGTAWTAIPNTPVGLESIAMVSATEGWAVGQDSIWHYKDAQWTDATASAPDPERNAIGESFLNLCSVSMPSATDGWAITCDGSARHYNGHQWVPVGSILPARPSGASDTLSAIHMTSPNEGWVVGAWHVGADPKEQATQIQAILAHYHNGTWSLVSMPRGQAEIYTTLDTLAMPSPTEGWAAGSGLMLHYTGGQWIKMQAPSAGITSISMGSPTDGWAISFGVGGIYHYHAGRWASELR